MKTIKIFPLTLTLLCALFFSCKHDPELVTSTRVVCFENQIRPIILASCATSGCHDASGGEVFPLLNYSDIRGKVEPGKPLQSRLYKVITANPHLWSIMPPRPGKPLNSAQMDYIEIWILQGAGDQLTGQDTASCNLRCDSTNVTFSKTINPINELYCKSCHSGTDPSGGISLIDYTTITSSVNSGRYVGAINHSAGYYSMPKGGPQLDPCSIKEIDKWIKSGMPNN